MTHRRENHARVELEFILHTSLELSDGQSLDLPYKANSIGTLFGNPLFLVGQYGSSESLLIFFLGFHFQLVFCTSVFQVRGVRGAQKGCLELLGRGGDVLF
jgi:hypothetical protein